MAASRFRGKNSCLHSRISLFQPRPPKITVIDSPNPNIKNERIVIQVRTLFDTDFTSPSIGGLFFCCTAPVESLGSDRHAYFHALHPLQTRWVIVPSSCRASCVGIPTTNSWDTQ